MLPPPLRHDQPHVAIKFFYSQGREKRGGKPDATPQEIVELAQEATHIARLRHPHIVPFLGFNMVQQMISLPDGQASVENYPYIVMAYANRGSLREFQRKQRLLPHDQAVDFIVQAASGVQHAHDNGILHRDLKPANLLLHQHPAQSHLDVWVADFGIAIQAHTETSLESQLLSGTYAYMPPEQQDKRAQRESDQYALGVVAYQFLTGKLPFEGTDPQIIIAHRDNLPPSFYETLKQTGNVKLMGLVLEQLEEVVMKALAKKPQERYTSVWDFAQTLQEAHVKGVEEENKQLRTFWTISDEELISPAKRKRLRQSLAENDTDPLREKKFEEAIKAYDQRIELNPTDSMAYYNKGIALKELRRYGEAVAAFDQAIRLNPNFTEAYYNKGKALGELPRGERFEEAIVAYDQAIRLNPNSSKAYSSKGTTLNALGRYEEAIAAYDQANILNPRYSRAIAEKGAILCILGKFSEASVCFQQAMACNPPNETVKRINRLKRQYNLS